MEAQHARRALIFSFVGLLAGCSPDGKGTADKAPETIVSFYGDSITSALHLTPRPVQRIAAMAGDTFGVRDWSSPGATVVAVRSGSAGLPFENFEQQMRRGDAGSVVVLRYGTADAGANTPESEFAEGLTYFIGLARKAGKMPILTGVPHVALNPAHPHITPGALQRLARYDGLVQQVAEATNTPFIDVRGVPFHGVADMLDEVHPAEAYSDRIGGAIAQYLLQVLKR